MRRLLACAAGIALCVSLPLQARQAGRVTEAEARRWANEAAAIANNNVKKFNSEFEKRAKVRIKTYNARGRDVLAAKGSGLYARLYGQVAAFQNSAAERVRLLKPLNDALFPSGPVLTISAYLMTSPLIERAVVKRGATVIEASENHVMETKARNLQGAVFDSREGSLVFTRETFEPVKGTEVRIMLIPMAGKNIDVKLYPAYVEAAFERLR